MVTQGIGVATGLQKKFDWVGVAAAGVGAGVGSAVGDWVGYKPGMAPTDPGFTHNAVLGGVSSMASGIANAATRSVINGSDFGDNIIAALPDTIGQTIGNMAADWANEAQDPNVGKRAPLNMFAGPGASAPSGEGMPAGVLPAQSHGWLGDLWDDVVSGAHWLERQVGIDPNAVDTYVGNAATATENGVESVVVSASNTISTFAQIYGASQIQQAQNELAMGRAGANAIQQGLKATGQWLSTPWRAPNGQVMQTLAVPMQDLDLVMALNPDFKPPMRDMNNGDKLGLILDGASAVLPLFKGLPLGTGATVAAEGGEFVGPVIGKSGYRSIDEFTDAVTSKYQGLYDQHYARTMQLVDRGLIPNDPLVIGNRTDALARVGLRNWLTNVEGIEEGSGQIIQVNRRLYDPAGTGAYRVPDVYIPGSQTVLDGSLSFKTGLSQQVMDFRAFSGGANTTIIRPATAPPGILGGSYGIIY